MTIDDVTVLSRYEVKEEDGRQTLVIKDLKLSDAGDFSCHIGDRETSAKLQVEEGNLFCYFTLAPVTI